MSRWWKRKRDEASDETNVTTPEFSDVKLVRKEPVDSGTGDGDDHDVLAELSEAFAGDEDDPGDAGENADAHPWNTPQSDPLLGAVSGGGSASADDDEKVDPEDADTEPTMRGAGPTTIAIGGDDELPDAVYLDDELEAGSGSDSAPVFIDDDGEGDAIAPKDATSRGVEPRLRQRRIGVRRAAGRRRLKWAAIVGGVLFVVIGGLAVLGSSLFAVDEVDVTGLRRADPDAVEAVVDDLVGEPVLLVDVEAAEERLEEIPYIEAARVRTDFPSSATIEILERVPVATAQGVDGRFRILDRDGRVLDVIDGQPIEFVVIEGTATLDQEAGQFADVGYSAAAAMVTKLTPEIRSRLISMSVVPDGTDLRLTLSNEPGPEIEARLGDAVSDSDQIERLVRLQRRLDDVVGSDTTLIDVSTVETIDQ
ncbi:cell division protein FtsQ/DivIB [Ilumatobacter nonamiensis]|uniref:cell division protein FtsQ/DivIB n=1 Tax=Ilumatobacter nonamiensis TaxID=467093 RepID=UPI000345AE1B|nr:FtsQ-type POTRA domain-containing protein [Ilumatobacter nonamiensis]